MRFIWFCASGDSFVVGRILLLIVVAVASLRATDRRLWWRLVIYASSIVAAVLIYMAAVPLAWWFLIMWLVLLLVWLACFSSQKATMKYLLVPLTGVILMGWMAAAGLLEAPFRQRPVIPDGQRQTLYVVGDSVSGGIGRADEQTWPRLLGSQHDVSVMNLAEAGATVATALKQVDQIDAHDTLVLVEIGGNDIFALTPYPEFRRNLEQLLAIASGDGRQVVMMELPLLPWQLEYGRIQRQLAKEHGVALIPKRYFVKVLSAEGASIDLAHLSPKGHQLMADQIWSIVGRSLMPVDR